MPSVKMRLISTRRKVLTDRWIISVEFGLNFCYIFFFLLLLLFAQFSWLIFKTFVPTRDKMKISAWPAGYVNQRRTYSRAKEKFFNTRCFLTAVRLPLLFFVFKRYYYYYYSNSCELFLSLTVLVGCFEQPKNNFCICYSPNLSRIPECYMHSFRLGVLLHCTWKGILVPAKKKKKNRSS